LNTLPFPFPQIFKLAVSHLRATKNGRVAELKPPKSGGVLVGWLAEGFEMMGVRVWWMTA
jgi:hypothetical protein